MRRLGSLLRFVVLRRGAGSVVNGVPRAPADGKITQFIGIHRPRARFEARETPRTLQEKTDEGASGGVRKAKDDDETTTTFVARRVRALAEETHP